MAEANSRKALKKIETAEQEKGENYQNGRK